MIDLSIIIPHYNSVVTLKKLIYSIPEKDNIQIIVIDDRSNKEVDELNKLIADFRFSHVTFLNNNTEKKGAGVCRNIGLENATGKWILFADSDDFFVRGFYDKVSNYFHTMNDVVYFNPQSIEVDTGKVSDRHLQYEKLITDYIHEKGEKTETFLRYKFFVPWSKLIRKDFLDKKGIFFDEVIASNDVMFSTKVGHYMKTFDATFDVIYCVTRDKGTLTTNTNIMIYDARTLVHINYCKFLREQLDIKRYKIIKPNGMGVLINGLKLRVGIKKLISVYSQFRKNKIIVFDIRFINPIFIFKKLNHHKKRQLNQKRYLSDKKII